MKLIIQRIEGDLFAYMETEAHHRSVGHRGVRLDPNLLRNDCQLENIPEGYMVFDIKPVPRKRKKQ